jgi:hypothetical protein
MRNRKEKAKAQIPKEKENQKKGEKAMTQLSPEQELHLDRKDWINFGFRKYVRMTLHDILEKWNSLAECHPGFAPPSRPNNNQLVIIINELLAEGLIYLDPKRSHEIGQNQYVSRRLLEAMGPDFVSGLANK